MSENWQEFQFSTADGMSSTCFFGTMPLKRVRLSGSWTYAAVRLTGPKSPRMSLTLAWHSLRTSTLTQNAGAKSCDDFDRPKTGIEQRARELSTRVK